LRKGERWKKRERMRIPRHARVVWGAGVFVHRIYGLFWWGGHLFIWID